MKFTYFKLFCLAFLLLQCTKKDENGPMVEEVGEDWNLVKVTGGFAGIEENIKKGSIIWTFVEADNTLKVKGNSDSVSIYSGLAEGSYSYSILENGGDSFLIVDSIEIGGINWSESEMVLDQNKNSNGSSADLYVLSFIK